MDIIIDISSIWAHSVEAPLVIMESVPSQILDEEIPQINVYGVIKCVIIIPQRSPASPGKS